MEILEQGLDIWQGKTFPEVKYVSFAIAVKICPNHSLQKNLSLHMFGKDFGS